MKAKSGEDVKAKEATIDSNLLDIDVSNIEQLEGDARDFLNAKRAGQIVVEIPENDASSGKQQVVQMQPNEGKIQSTVRSRGVFIVEQNREVQLEQGMSHNKTGDRVVHTALKEAVFSVPNETIVQIEARQPDGGHKNVIVIEKYNVADVDRVSHGVLPEATDAISHKFIVASGQVNARQKMEGLSVEQIQKNPTGEDKRLNDIPAATIFVRMYTATAGALNAAADQAANSNMSNMYQQQVGTLGDEAVIQQIQVVNPHNASAQMTSHEGP
nr:uncharacterized protein LOC104105289 isoform X2 [Nicotiana tomentosiformis]